MLYYQGVFYQKRRNTMAKTNPFLFGWQDDILCRKTLEENIAGWAAGHRCELG